MKPIIKNKKKFLQNLGISLVSLVLATGIVIVLHKDDNTNTDSSSVSSDSSISSVEKPNSSSNPDSSSNNDNPVVDNLTFEEFMNKHSDVALTFASDYVKQGLINNKTPLSETWGFHANEDDELDSISLTYTYASGETSRVLEVANATFIEPIDLDKIVSGDFAREDTAYHVTHEVAFEFDAKNSYLDSELANALFENVGESENYKYYKETKSDRSDSNKYQVAEQSSSAINVYTIYVEGESEEEVIANLKSQNFEKSHHATYPLGDKESITINTATYELEEFAPETVAELLNDYGDEIRTALDTYLLEKSCKSSFGNSFDPKKLESYHWEFEEGNEINQIKLIATYNKYSNSTMYAIRKINLKKSINVKDLTKHSINTLIAEATSNATQSQEYIFGYNPAEQGTRDDLVNSVFEAYGMSKEYPKDAERYFVDTGYLVDTTLQSEARSFKFVEIKNNEVTEFSISIKNSSNDKEYIEKLKDKTNYRIYDEKSCTMEGIKLQGYTKGEIEALADSQSNYDLTNPDEKNI